MTGDEQKTVITKFDILSLDNSELTESTGDSCNCFEALGFTILEMLVMTILAFGIIVGLFRMATYLKKKILKKREARRSSKQQKELEMRRKIEQEIQQTVAMSADNGEKSAETSQMTVNACAGKTSGKLEYP